MVTVESCLLHPCVDKDMFQLPVPVLQFAPPDTKAFEVLNYETRLEPSRFPFLRSILSL